MRDVIRIRETRKVHRRVSGWECLRQDWCERVYRGPEEGVPVGTPNDTEREGEKALSDKYQTRMTNLFSMFSVSRTGSISHDIRNTDFVRDLVS